MEEGRERKGEKERGREREGRIEGERALNRKGGDEIGETDPEVFRQQHCAEAGEQTGCLLD